MKDEKTQMAEQTEKEMKEAFDLFDEDGSGTISREELMAALKVVQTDVSEPQLREMIDAIDVNKDGVISFEEFKEMLGKCNVKRIGEPTEEEIELVFNMLDKDENHYLAAHELKALVKKIEKDITDSEIEQMITIADEDGDRMLNMMEFKKIMMRKDQHI